MMCDDSNPSITLQILLLASVEAIQTVSYLEAFPLLFHCKRNRGYFHLGEENLLDSKCSSSLYLLQCHSGE